ncbi:hypothetical protein AGMMS50267_10760 [Spirochaetia bacterium]|nr:hypothetical protein AGMMS50267_10760 [Spirochaetia bacterium]
MVMENFGIICGVTLGLFGSVFSVVQFFYQRYKDKEQAEQAARDREQAAKDKEEAAKEAAKEAARQEIRDRLTLLMQVIIDKDIPRESRQPFFDEYIAKGGNGTVLKFWLENK